MHTLPSLHYGMQLLGDFARLSLAPLSGLQMRDSCLDIAKHSIGADAQPMAVSVVSSWGGLEQWADKRLQGRSGECSLMLTLS